MPISAPQYDENGNVIPHDHPEIAAEDGVIRRISEEQLTTDKITGQRRISSKAYKVSSGPNEGMSIDLEALIVEAGGDPRLHVTTPRWIGSVRFVTKTLRDAGLQVGFDPLVPENPYHGQAWGEFSKPVQKVLRQAATWFVEIEGVAL